VLKHVFASTGPKAKPVYIDVNGRKGRRAVCVLYGDAMRYEVLDLDAAIDEEEVGEEGEEGEGEEMGSEEEEVDTEN
jgi:anaphase-promoting complex subunit 4